MNTGFEKTFDEYHDLIRKEIAKDTSLDDKLSKVEQLVYLMHSIVSDRFSPDYNKVAMDYRGILKKGSYFDKEADRKITVNYNSPETKRQRLSFLREWLSLMLAESPTFKLEGNMNRVEFGD